VISVAELSAIADPRERAEKAAELVRYATSHADKARLERNRAALAMHVAHVTPAALIWRDTLGISRNLWNRLLKEYEEGKITPAENLVDPTGAARRAVERKRHWERVADEARKVRDDVALELMDGSWGGPPLRNAEIVRLTGLTSARVAQVRTAV
jgi:hypothetical protein